MKILPFLLMKIYQCLRLLCFPKKQLRKVDSKLIHKANKKKENNEANTKKENMVYA
jgi:hypothetical protein